MNLRERETRPSELLRTKYQDVWVDPLVKAGVLHRHWLLMIRRLRLDLSGDEAAMTHFSDWRRDGSQIWTVTSVVGRLNEMSRNFAVK